MGTIANSYASITPWANAANANALANNQAKRLCGAQDMAGMTAGTAPVNAEIHVGVTLNSAGVSATGTIEIWAVPGLDTTQANTADNIDTTANTDQAANLKNSVLLVSLTANAVNQVVSWDGYLVGCGGPYQLSDVPAAWTIYLYNKSGAAISANSATGGFRLLNNSY
jgi:hypothetical protein